MLQPAHDSYRQRLLEETRISVKSLLSTCHDNMIDDNSPQLERFCLVLEKILRHGLKDKSTIFGKKDYWNVLEVLPKFHPAASDSVRNVSDLSHVRTVLGRGRAWIRFALIEKKLEEYLRVLLLFPQSEQHLSSWYESYAFVRVPEEVEMFLALLAPVSIVDFSLCLKDIDFDNLPSDLGFYVVQNIFTAETSTEKDEPEETAEEKEARERKQEEARKLEEEKKQKQFEQVFNELDDLIQKDKELEELRAKLEEAEKKIQENEGKDMELASLQAKVKEMEEQESSFKSEETERFKQVEQKVIELESKIKEQDLVVLDKDKEVYELRRNLTEKEREIKSTSDKKVELEGLLVRERESKVKELAEERLKFASTTEGLQGEVKLLRSKQAEAERLQAEKDEQIRQEQAKLKLECEKLDALTKLVEDREVEIAELKNSLMAWEVKELKREKGLERAETPEGDEEDEGAEKQEVDDGEEAEEPKASDDNRLALQIEEKDKVIKQLQEQLDSYSVNIKGKDAALQKKDEELLAAEAKLQEATEKLKELERKQSEKDSVSHDTDSLKEEIQSLKDTIKAAGKELGQTKLLLEFREKEIDALKKDTKNRIEEAEKETQRVKKELEVRVSDFEELTKEHMRVQQEKATIESLNNGVESEAKIAELNANVENLTAALGEAQEKLKKSEQDRESFVLANVKAKEEMESALQEKFLRVKHDIDTKMVMAKELRVSLEAKSQEVEALKEDVQKKDEELKKIREQMENELKGSEEVRMHMEEMVVAKTLELQALRESKGMGDDSFVLLSTEADKKKIAELEEKLQQLEERKGRRVAELEEMVRDKADRLESVSRLMKESEERMKSQEEKHSQLSAAKDRLEAQIRYLDARNNENTQKYEEEIKGLEATISQQCEQVVILKKLLAVKK